MQKSHKKRFHFRTLCLLFSMALSQVLSPNPTRAEVLNQQQMHQDKQMHRQNEVDLPLDESFLEKGGIQYYFSFLKKGDFEAWKNFNRDEVMRRDEKIPENLKQMLLLDELDKHTVDFRAHHIQILKSAYVIDTKFSDFKKRDIFDKNYLEYILKDGRVEIKDNRFSEKAQYRFHDGRNFHPSFTFWLYDLRNNMSDHRKSKLSRFAEEMDHGALAALEFVTYQRSYDFDRVMGQKTGEEAVTVSFHEPFLNGNQTLVRSYSLQYLHSHPPGLFGGIKKLFDQTVEGIRESVERIRGYHQSYMSKDDT